MNDEHTSNLMANVKQNDERTSKQGPSRLTCTHTNPPLTGDEAGGGGAGARGRGRGRPVGLLHHPGAVCPGTIMLDKGWGMLP
jgi:hypothetical protein